jgi:hypothetical protein
MRRLLIAAAALAAACASPRPCTRALCPLPPLDGSYRVHGWNSAVTVVPGVPAIPIVSDSTVDVLSGRASFRNGQAVVTASAGATFQFQVSTGNIAVSSILVSSGEVTVALSSGAAPSPVGPGAPYFLPVAKK